ncbi:MAG: phosphoenolpyruvate--protein phosphotransferase [Oscillospiraceae bacterium]
MSRGIGVSAGIGLAQARLWNNHITFDYVPRKSSQPADELSRFEAARQDILDKTLVLRNRTALRYGDSQAVIFDAYHLILNDHDGLVAPLRELINQHQYSAEYAIYSKFNDLAHQFSQFESEYFRQRVEDIVGLRDALLQQLEGVKLADLSHLDRPTILVASALTPAEIANIDTSRLAGVICESGAYSSHTSIIARTLGIPMVVGLAGILADICDGDLVALDGETGEIWLEPDQSALAAIHRRGDEIALREASVQTYRGRPTISTDGRRIELSANVGQLEEVAPALTSDAESVGLFRTELLHLSFPNMPTEEEQFGVYRTLLERMGGKAVTVRTFDDGGNTPTLPIKTRPEPNPALGYRGIRMSLGRPSFFRTQLRALLRASAYGNLKIMFPMVSTLDELSDALNALQQIKNELRREDIPFDEKIPVGVDIEVPAAALLAEAIAPQVDFLSIGINDLIQFTLAIDRNNLDVSHLYNPYHPAVLRLVRSTIDAAHANAIPCVLCGEIPGQDQILPLMLGLGIDGFSTTPSLILPARRVLNSCNYTECRALADEVLKLGSSADVYKRLNQHQQAS